MQHMLAAVLGLRLAAAVLNDTNAHLINFYQWLQRGLVITIEMAHDKDLYYEHRRRFNGLIQSGGKKTAEAASLFYYFNRPGRIECSVRSLHDDQLHEGFQAYTATLSGWQLKEGEPLVRKHVVEVNDL